MSDASRDARRKAIACLRLASDATLSMAIGGLSDSEIVELRRGRDEALEEAVDELVLAAQEAFPKSG